MARKKLAILSYAFSPSIGGIETVSSVLAKAFAERGYEVAVITSTPGDDSGRDENFRIVRNPGKRQLIAEIRQADIVLQSNSSLNLAWPLWVLFPRKPFVLVHHCPIARTNGDLAWQDLFKRALLGRPYCLSVSEYLASTIEKSSKVIRNPYDSSTFRIIKEQSRDRDLLFVGRLVTAKGADVLLRAFDAVLRERPETTLSMVGSGPEEGALHELAKTLGIEGNTCFRGTRRGTELAEEMNRHKILVVPSRSCPPEALPVVPIEGIACGCIPVASRMGGLPESVGKAGVLFEEGNSEELASVLLRLLNSKEEQDRYRAEASEHLRQFEPDVIVEQYERHFAACMR